MAKAKNQNDWQTSLFGDTLTEVAFLPAKVDALPLAIEVLPEPIEEPIAKEKRKFAPPVAPAVPVLEFPEEHIHELWVRQLQLRPGYPVLSKFEREDIAEKLVRRFQGLLVNVTRQTYRPANGETYSNWAQDTMSQFLILAIEDYLPKEYGGTAVFGHYIQQKLYWKMVYAGQKAVAHYARQSSTDAFHNQGVSMDDDEHSGMSSALNAYMLETATGADEEVVLGMRDKEISDRVSQIRDIAAKVLNEREQFIWSEFLESPLMVREIGERCEPPISVGRTRQIIDACRNKILVELGRVGIRGTLSH